MTQQPEALRLADWLDKGICDAPVVAAELRRLYAEVDNLSYRLAYPDNFEKEYVGLTDDELRALEKEFNAVRVRTPDEEYLVIYPSDYWAWQRAIEAKLREKNGGKA